MKGETRFYDVEHVEKVVGWRWCPTRDGIAEWEDDQEQGCHWCDRDDEHLELYRWGALASERSRADRLAEALQEIADISPTKDASFVRREAQEIARAALLASVEENP